jgi:hypothetical protein
MGPDDLKQCTSRAAGFVRPGLGRSGVKVMFGTMKAVVAAAAVFAGVALAAPSADAGFGYYYSAPSYYYAPPVYGPAYSYGFGGYPSYGYSGYGYGHYGYPLYGYGYSYPSYGYGGYG